MAAILVHVAQFTGTICDEHIHVLAKPFQISHFSELRVLIIAGKRI